MMTRDAKIGLLVGLAFILIVGILLSEHITAATAPQQASLTQAGEHVRRAVSAPVAQVEAVEPVTVDPNPLPKTTVVTRDVIDSPQLPPTARIELGPAKGGEIKVIRVDTPQDAIASATQVQPIQPQTIVQPLKVENSMLVATNPDAKTTESKNEKKTNDHPLQDAARAGGMELVDVKTVPTPTDAKSDAKQGDTKRELPPIANGSKVREYVAQAGDSLGKIASKQLGANTPANRGAIVALNPSLQKDNNRILVGAKYLLPADAWAAALGVDSNNVELASAKKPAAPATPATSTTPAQAAPAATNTTTATTLYTVQSGDSLWKIAEREVGSTGAVAQIKTLNAAVLGDSETVKVGMKLTLPKKL